MDEDKIRQIAREEFAHLFTGSRFTFQNHIQIFDGRNIQSGRAVGTKIGTGSDQKLGFFGATPVIRQPAPTTLANVISALQALGFTS
jgi:hypothetical protein